MVVLKFLLDRAVVLLKTVLMVQRTFTISFLMKEKEIGKVALSLYLCYGIKPLSVIVIDRYSFYCRGYPGTNPYVADCLNVPSYRCFTRWPINSCVVDNNIIDLAVFQLGL